MLSDITKIQGMNKSKTIEKISDTTESKRWTWSTIKQDKHDIPNKQYTQYNHDKIDKRDKPDKQGKQDIPSKPNTQIDNTNNIN